MNFKGNFWKKSQVLALLEIFTNKTPDFKVNLVKYIMFDNIFTLIIDNNVFYFMVIQVIDEQKLLTILIEWKQEHKFFSTTSLLTYSTLILEK